MSRIDDIEAHVRALEAELRALRRFPDDEFAEGTLIRFELPFERVTPRTGDALRTKNANSFTFAALKVSDRWWLTGRYLPGEVTANRSGISYDRLRETLSHAVNVRVFTGDGEPLSHEIDVIAHVEGWCAPEKGDVTVIGPECFASPDGQVISWRGRNYVPQESAREREDETE